ncbi:hypothetical protein FTUN_1406 [Frigoriglobus tundricola]|uniref:Uncharacterized protein n=1 Tax=Frigoriglobus tundricola TaxID=2774151 RepID=A0A6M5YLN0_9BACT|nr:hypothetical protein FTUN_1406 [Frigoriglobus tundricola]
MIDEPFSPPESQGFRPVTHRRRMAAPPLRLRARRGRRSLCLCCVPLRA